MSLTQAMLFKQFSLRYSHIILLLFLEIAYNYKTIFVSFDKTHNQLKPKITSTYTQPTQTELLIEPSPLTQQNHVHVKRSTSIIQNSNDIHRNFPLSTINKGPFQTDANERRISR